MADISQIELPDGNTYDIKDANAIPATEKGVNNGVAELDTNGKVPSSQLPSYVDDVVEVADYASLPSTGETGKIYVTLDDNKTYRWSGTAYVEISPSLALGETSSTAYRGDRGKTAYDHATESGRASTTASGLYKIGVTAEGHVASATPVQKSDITALGIPAQDTTYTASGNIEIDNNVIKRKEVWLNNMSDYNALSSVDPDTDYHVKGIFAITFSANKVIITDNDGNLIASDITTEKLNQASDLTEAYRVVNGELYVVYDDGL